MKLNIAFKTLLAAICTASQARARVPSRLRDPRTVEEKEEVHRQTMGDYVSTTMLGTHTCAADGSNCATCEKHLADAEATFRNYVNLSAEEAKSLACTAVSNNFAACQGCQGFSQVGKEVHIPGCVGMTSKTCEELAKGIVQEKPGWFKDGNSTSLVPEDHLVDMPSEMTYYKLGLPVSAADERAEGLKTIMGVAGKCMVHYSWDWCVLSSSSSNGEDTVCLKLQPWDCSGGADSECLSSSECCAKIQGEYPKPDINGNELQCYEWILPVKSSGSSGGNTLTSDGGGSSNTGSSGGVTGNRLVIHLNGDKVALPAVITDGTYQHVHEEEVIVPKVCPKSFPDLATLQNAVTAYVSEDCVCLASEGCTSNLNCATGQEWGYPINSWCVEQVTSFEALFVKTTRFNEDVNGWNTRQVTNMEKVFSYSNFFNQPLDNWDVSSVRSFDKMFYDAHAFNQPLDNWDTSSATTMNQMFFEAKWFNQPVDNWNVAQITNMQSMFHQASRFNQPLNNWDVSKVTTMHKMFTMTRVNQPLNNWDTSSVTNMESLFEQNKVFNQPLDNWDVSSVRSFDRMFYQAYAFDQPLDNWDTSSVYTMSEMFMGTRAFNQPLNNWDTSSVTTMRGMFKGNYFNQPLDNWDVSKVTTMGYMFNYNPVFNQPLNKWNVASCTSFSRMFQDATAFNQNLCMWGAHFGGRINKNYYRMFDESGCRFKDDSIGQFGAAGPWCNAFYGSTCTP